MRKLTLTGKVNSKGKLVIHGQDELTDFLSKNLNKRLMLTLRVYQPGTSIALRGYYVAKVIPDFQEAFKHLGEWLSLKETEKRMREISPICWNEEMTVEGKMKRELREIIDLDHGILEIEDFDNSELVQHIEFLRQYAAENLGIFIDDPKTVIK